MNRRPEPSSKKVRTSPSVQQASHAPVPPPVDEVLAAKFIDGCQDLFSGADTFLSLLVRQALRQNQVVARSYGNGAWSQFSGRDLGAHLGRASAIWLKEFPLPSQPIRSRTLLFISRNTYSSFVAGFGAMLAGLDVMFMPVQASDADLKWCLNFFQGVGIATDIDDLAKQLGHLGVPVYNVASTTWIAQDRHAEPELFQIYRDYKAALPLLKPLENPVESQKVQKPGVPNVGGQASKSEAASHSASFSASASMSPSMAEALRLERLRSLTVCDPLRLKGWSQVRVGRMQFISYGHDGFQKPESLAPDAFVLTAQNFILHVSAPPSIFWQSMELMLPSNPFAHLARFCVLLKNGVIGFPNTSTDWQTNLRILRPSVVFASPVELDILCDFVNKVTDRAVFRSRLALSQRFEKARGMLKSSRALKLPETVFDTAHRCLRTASRLAVGQQLIDEAVGELRFVVHGLSSAQEGAVRTLERLGIPVIETYGVTAAAGMLSSNTYEAAHFNLIGSPLPHVSFRLGAHSTLEYRLSAPVYGSAGVWQETGDVAQMTPYGFVISGRRRHLFVTGGGVIVSPIRLEKRLKEQELIADACIVGDRMPFLSALIVLSPGAQADYRENQEAVRLAVQDIISTVNETLPRNATIKKFVILEKPFQEADGERLPSGAINRLKIHETRGLVIDSLYN